MFFVVFVFFSKHDGARKHAPGLLKPATISGRGQCKSGLTAVEKPQEASRRAYVSLCWISVRLHPTGVTLSAPHQRMSRIHLFSSRPSLTLPNLFSLCPVTKRRFSYTAKQRKNVPRTQNYLGVSRREVFLCAGCSFRQW